MGWSDEVGRVLLWGDEGVLVVERLVLQRWECLLLQYDRRLMGKWLLCRLEGCLIRDKDTVGRRQWLVVGW